jgi:hypothetical protein
VLAYNQSRVQHDSELVKATFRLANKILSDGSRVPSALAAITPRKGHWDESIVYFEQAVVLDPQYGVTHRCAAQTRQKLVGVTVAWA